MQLPRDRKWDSECSNLDRKCDNEYGYLMIKSGIVSIVTSKTENEIVNTATSQKMG